MENSAQAQSSGRHNSASSSGLPLQLFFQQSLQELYYAKKSIADTFTQIQDRIRSPQLQAILSNHHHMHLAHKKRLEKIFCLHDIPAVPKDCGAVKAILAQANENLNVFSGDIESWEITLILTTRKLVHYKIAFYGAVAHLAIRLNHTEAATLLAISVQEEEEFVEKYLNRLTNEFLCPYKMGVPVARKKI